MIENRWRRRTWWLNQCSRFKGIDSQWTICPLAKTIETVVPVVLKIVTRCRCLDLQRLLSRQHFRNSELAESGDWFHESLCSNQNSGKETCLPQDRFINTIGFRELGIANQMKISVIIPVGRPTTDRDWGQWFGIKTKQNSDDEKSRGRKMKFQIQTSQSKVVEKFSNYPISV